MLQDIYCHAWCGVKENLAEPPTTYTEAFAGRGLQALRGERRIRAIAAVSRSLEDPVEPLQSEIR